MNWYAAKKEHLGYIHMHVESKALFSKKSKCRWKSQMDGTDFKSIQDDG